MIKQIQTQQNKKPYTYILYIIKQYNLHVLLQQYIFLGGKWKGNFRFVLAFKSLTINHNNLKRDLHIKYNTINTKYLWKFITNKNRILFSICLRISYLNFKNLEIYECTLVCIVLCIIMKQTLNYVLTLISDAFN